MRFTTKENTRNSWTVLDRESKKWNGPEFAISIFVQEKTAKQIAKLLNKEWENFLKHPW